MPTNISKTLIFPRGGKIIFVEHNANGTITYSAAKMLTNTGVVESITSKLNINTTDLPDGNADFPMGVYDTGREGTLEVKMSSFDPRIEAKLTGATYTEQAATANMWSVDEEIAVPIVGPFKVQLEHTPKNSDNDAVLVVDIVSSPFVETNSAPSAGQFQVSGDYLVFASADAGKPLYATYDYTGTYVTKNEARVIGARPVLQAIVEGTAYDKDENRTFPFNVVVDKCKAQGDVSMPVMQRAPQGWTFTLRILKPRPGYAPVYKRFYENT